MSLRSAACTSSGTRPSERPASPSRWASITTATATLSDTCGQQRQPLFRYRYRYRSLYLSISIYLPTYICRSQPRQPRRAIPVKRETGHTHTQRQRTTPPTPTHTHAHDKNNTPNPQTNTSHEHLTTLEGGATATPVVKRETGHAH